MINSFLATLHNDDTPPVSGSSTTGDVLWPSPLTVKTYTGAAALANIILFENQSGFNHFLTAIQLLWVVQESVLADQILVDDPRVSYNEQQLLGQFEDASGYDLQQISRIISRFDDIPALQFLVGDDLHVYRSALSRLDKLAAIICFFGRRGDD